MRDWLILKLTAMIQFLMSLKKSAAPPPPPHEEVRETCPICGIDWDKGEIFCFNCGYELRDENFPLNPPPERTGSITDPDGKIGVEMSAKYRNELDSIAKVKGLDIAIFLLPSALMARIQERAPEEHLDGFAFDLYNTWRVGKDTRLKGMLLVIDPSSADRALVLGKNGPRVEGSKFRGWYEGMKLQEEESARLSSEVASIIGRISSLEG